MECAKKETNNSYEAKHEKEKEINLKSIENEIKDDREQINSGKNTFSIINNIHKYNLKKVKSISIEEVFNEYDSNNLKFLDKNKDSLKYKYIEE